jgi:HEAT repeat protein
MNDTLTYINTLYHPDETIRLQGESELRKLGMAALEPLLRVLNGEHKPPRFKRPTGWLGIGPSSKELEAYARRRAAALLGRLRDPRATEALLAATQNGADEGLRQAAALALGEQGDPRAVEPLIEALYSSDYSIRAQAAEMLGRLRSRQAVDALIRMALTDGQPGPRWQAMRALGLIGDARAVPALTAILQNLLALPAADWAVPDRLGYSEDETDQPLWATCNYALEALATLGSAAQSATPIVQQMANEAPARTIRLKAEKCLARIQQGHTE